MVLKLDIDYDIDNTSMLSFRNGLSNSIQLRNRSGSINDAFKNEIVE